MNYESFNTQEEGQNYLESILATETKENTVTNHSFSTGMNYGPNANLSGGSLTVHYDGKKPQVFSYYVCE
jgi:hypothetical protein